MQWLVLILQAVLRVVLPWLATRLTPKAEESARRPELRRRLADRVRSTWHAGTAAILLVGLLLVVGCNPRTIYVPHGEPVRLRERLEGVRVWVVDENGRPVAGTMDLPEGWFCLPDPGPAANLFPEPDKPVPGRSTAGRSRLASPPASCRPPAGEKAAPPSQAGSPRAPPAPAARPVRRAPGPGAMIRSPTPRSSEDPINRYARGSPSVTAS